MNVPALRIGNQPPEYDLKTAPHPASIQPTHALRAALGIRSVTGQCEAEGVRIAWEATPAVAGAQAILCLHAAGAGSREFRPLMSRCPTGCRFILIDWPGHGRSEEPRGGVDSSLSIDSCAGIVDTVIHQLGIVKPILLASGFGAAVAIRYAASHAEAVLGLALCLPSGLIQAHNRKPGSSARKRALKDLLNRMTRFAPGKCNSPIAMAARRHAMRMEVLWEPLQTLRVAAENAANRETKALRNALDSLSCPAFFALSHDSHEYPLSSYLALLDPSLSWALRHRYTVFAGAFHPIWDEPNRFAIALGSFVQALLPVENHTHAWILSAVDWPAKDSNLWKCVHPDCRAEQVLTAGLDANRQ